MIENFNGPIYLILFIILLLGNVFYAYCTLINTKNWLDKYGTHHSAVLITRILGSLISGFCYGCGRSNEDKAGWKNPETPNEWKNANLATIRNRLNGWQKEAFDKSYAFKKETGMSLIKKKLLEQKK